MTIFKAYDIRGKYPLEINEDIMFKIGRAFADSIKGKKIAVGRDARLSSKALFDSFCKGVLLQGKDVIDFGLSSTPKGYFACCELNADACAIITASHNPKEYNGVKFTKKYAIPIGQDSGLKKIEKRFEKNKFKKIKNQGKLTKKNIDLSYKKHLEKIVSCKNLKIVFDASNGVGANDFKLIENKLNSKIKKLSCKIDGNFPDHDPNPMQEKATDNISKEILKTKSDIGIIFDGDADRAFFLDEKGRLISSDLVTILISKEIISKKKSKILYDLRSSNIVSEKVKEFGGKSKMCKVGHSFIKKAMRKEKADFAGELSGHFYFKFIINNKIAIYDSAIVTSLYLLNLLSKENKKLSELIDPLKKYFQSGEINVKVENKQEKIKELKNKYKGKIIQIDGVRIDFQDWWFNVRPSNTEPYLRLNLEAKTKSLMESKTKEILSILKK